jgi:hypothetical protein
MEHGKRWRPPTVRSRSGQAAIPELAQLQGLDLARWASGCISGGLTMVATASLGRTHLQAHAEGHPGPCSRSIGEAPPTGFDRPIPIQRRFPERWPRRSLLQWPAVIDSLKPAAEGPSGSRQWSSLQGQWSDLQGFLTGFASACNEARQLPPEQQPQNWPHASRPPLQHPPPRPPGGRLMAAPDAATDPCTPSGSHLCQPSHPAEPRRQPPNP